MNEIYITGYTIISDIGIENKVKGCLRTYIGSILHLHVEDIILEIFFSVDETIYKEYN